MFRTFLELKSIQAINFDTKRLKPLSPFRAKLNVETQVRKLLIKIAKFHRPQPSKGEKDINFVKAPNLGCVHI